MDYHSDKFTDFSLMVYKNNKLFALLPAHIIGTKIFSHAGLTYGSFILLDSAKLLDVSEAFTAALKFLNEQDVIDLQIKIIPSFYNVVPSDELEFILYKIGAKLEKREALMVIDFKHQLKFQKKRREGINKANRHNLKIAINGDYKAFWNEILIPNLSTKHDAKPVHSLKEIEQLASQFPNNIKQVNVYQDDKIVAGCTVFITKTTIHPQYVSGNLEKNKNGSLDYLYHFLINDFISDKHYFDFNTSSEQNGEVLNSGLIFWKESCGARTFVANTYSVATEIYKSFSIKTK